MPRKPKPPKDEFLAALIAAHLTPFEEQEVIRAAVEVPNAGGGLHAALAFEPVELAHGDEVFLLARCRVKKVRFDEIKDSDALVRVHVLDAKETAFVPADFAEKFIIDQRDRIARLREQAQGITRITDGAGTVHVGGEPEGEGAEILDLSRGEVDPEGYFDPGARGYPTESEEDDEG